MKVVLIVASGVHQGKKIPVAGPQFLIGRDPHCQLRPASQAISKQHCGILLRDGKVFAIDYGSTNGTSVNDEMLQPNQERELKQGDRLKAGPLDFTVALAAGSSTATPLPSTLQAGGAGPTDKLPPATKPATPKPPPAKAGSDDDIAAMLLGMNDNDTPSSGSGSYGVPEGSTVMEIPTGEAKDAGQPKPEEKKTDSKEDSSNAANELLRRYMRRPR